MNNEICVVCNKEILTTEHYFTFYLNKIWHYIHAVCEKNYG